VSGVTIPIVAVAGNPNTGKTSIFNQLTGGNARVGNYPGITVETQHGHMARHGSEEHERIEVIDIPGCYSLSARSPEERIAIDSILGWNGRPRPDAVIIVLDASQLIRNLYLAVQCIEFEVPCVLALNMIDEAGSDPLQTERVSEIFGVPCVPTSARTGAGIADLHRAVTDAVSRHDGVAKALDIPYPAAVTAAADDLAVHLPANWPPGIRDDQPHRPMALWTMTSLDEEDEFVDVPRAVRDAVQLARQHYPDDIETDIIQARYRFLEEQLERQGELDPVAQRHHRRTARLDRVLRASRSSRRRASCRCWSCPRVAATTPTT
jgi:ferrous iron transport protein B